MYYNLSILRNFKVYIPKTSSKYTVKDNKIPYSGVKNNDSLTLKILTVTKKNRCK